MRCLVVALIRLLCALKRLRVDLLCFLVRSLDRGRQIAFRVLPGWHEHAPWPAPGASVIPRDSGWGWLQCQWSEVTGACTPRVVPGRLRRPRSQGRFQHEPARRTRPRTEKGAHRRLVRAGLGENARKAPCPRFALI